jgi:hypothetical protein
VLENVTVVHVRLLRSHALGQLVLGAYGSEVPGVGLDGVLEPPFRRVRRQHRASRERRWISPARDAVRAGIGALIGGDIKWRPPDYRKGHQMCVDRARVPRQVHINPVLHCSHARRFRGPQLEVHGVQVKHPVDRLGCDFIEGDVPCRRYGTTEIGGTSRQGLRNSGRSRLTNPRSNGICRTCVRVAQE